jgi:hypothetical protein
MTIPVKMRFFPLAVAAISVLAGIACASDDSVATRAATVIASSEAIATAARAYHAKHGRVPQQGPNDLIKGGFLKEYPRTTSPQSDFESQPTIIDEGTGSALFVRYNFTEPGDSDVCRALNAIKMKLRSDASISETNLAPSPRMQGAEVFSPLPVEIVGKEAFCLRITASPHYAYFLRVMPLNP